MVSPRLTALWNCACFTGTEMARHLASPVETIAPKFLGSSWTPLAYFGEAIHRAGTQLGPRMCQNYELFYLVEGEAEVKSGDTAQKLRGGQVYLFRPGLQQVVRFGHARKVHHVRCAVVNAQLVSADLAAACGRASSVTAITQRSTSLLEVGLSLPRLASERAHGLIEALGMATLQEFLFDGECTQLRETHEPAPLRRAIEWIERTQQSSIDVPTLAQQAGVSPTQLLRLFNEHLATTPIRYVWESRARRGMRLLAETELPVGEVAWRCGFQTPFHFSRWVKKLSGVSPLALRTRERKAG